jgi:hypothetical protein
VPVVLEQRCGHICITLPGVRIDAGRGAAPDARLDAKLDPADADILPDQPELFPGGQPVDQQIAAKPDRIERLAHLVGKVADRSGIDQGNLRHGNVGHGLSRRMDQTQRAAHRVAEQGANPVEQGRV